MFDGEYVMKIYTVQDRTYDGIREIKLFTRECSAKAYCRKKNKEVGSTCYEAVEMEAEEE